jgi:thiamine-phosphate pyrophosphorylase
VFRLLAITPPEGPVDPGCVGAWLGAGIRASEVAVLLRRPGRDAATILADLALHPVREACAQAGITVLLGCSPGDVPAALPAGLSGVQLRGDPGAREVEEARARLGPSRRIGRSIHALPGPATVDFSVAGPVFAPRTTRAGAPKKPLESGMLRAIARALPEPVFALGGIDGARARACLREGAFGVAGIFAFFGAPARVGETARDLTSALRDAGVSPDRS